MYFQLNFLSIKFVGKYKKMIKLKENSVIGSIHKEGAFERCVESLWLYLYDQQCISAILAH